MTIPKVKTVSAGRARIYVAKGGSEGGGLLFFVSSLLFWRKEAENSR